MAPPKRKKLEKIEEVVPVSTQKCYCSRCGTAYSRSRGYFPVSHSPMYRGSGFLPWCNNCVDDMYEYYRKLLGDDREALRRICMKMDLYWSDAIYAMVEKTSGTRSRVRNYIGKTNIIRYIDKTFDDTLVEEAAAEKQEQSAWASVTSDDEPVQAEPEVEIEVPQEVVDFWGTGFAPEFYEELERRYKEWTNGNEVADPSVRALYQQVCILQTTISRDAAQGKAIDKNVNALTSVLGSMNLKPAQKKEEGGADLDKMPLGVGIQKWEFQRPLPKTEQNKKDVHQIIKNITTWYLGHACKMVGLRNSYCKMYEDEMDKLRVDHPEYDEEDDDTVLSDLFGGDKASDEDGTEGEL